MLCIDFALFLKGLILREFQNIEKYLISDKSMILKKWMHSYVSKVDSNRNFLKKKGWI